jgi:hypothetical protein
VGCVRQWRTGFGLGPKSFNRYLNTSLLEPCEQVFRQPRVRPWIEIPATASDVILDTTRLLAIGTPPFNLPHVA